MKDRNLERDRSFWKDEDYFAQSDEQGVFGGTGSSKGIRGRKDSSIGINDLLWDSRERNSSSKPILKNPGQKAISAFSLSDKLQSDKINIQFAGEEVLITPRLSRALIEIKEYLESRNSWDPDNLLLIHCKNYQVHLVFKLNFLETEDLEEFKNSIKGILFGLRLINDHFFAQHTKSYWNIILGNTYK